MNSERQKREEEIARLMRESRVNREADVAFREEIRKTAAAIIQKETSRIQQSEPVKSAKRFINPLTAGLWLLVLAGAAFVFAMPAAGAVLLVCGIAAIFWPTVLKQAKK
jgi:hypothetical protein